MSIETCSTQEQGMSAGSDDAAPCSKTRTVGSATATAQVDADSNDALQVPTGSASVPSSASTLLSSLWSPLGSLLSSSRPNGTDKDVSNATESSHEDSKSEKKKDTNSYEDNKKNQTDSSRHSDSKTDTEVPPEPVYAPQEVPTYKALQKKRLTGTRTKQLLRAASRAYDDPPTEPELGMCCGSSCDPCVNDLWREERAVWRERWGDGRVEDIRGAEGRRKELEW